MYDNVAGFLCVYYVSLFWVHVKFHHNGGHFMWSHFTYVSNCIILSQNGRDVINGHLYISDKKIEQTASNLHICWNTADWLCQCCWVHFKDVALSPLVWIMSPIKYIYNSWHCKEMDSNFHPFIQTHWKKVNGGFAVIHCRNTDQMTETW